MPCSDVTEVLSLRLDEGEHLLSYTLHKRTCGRGVGDSGLLAGRLSGKTAAEILELSGETWEFGTTDEVEQFLELKHLFGLQAGLRALLGQEAAGASDPVSASRVAFEEQELLFEAELSVDILTERIESCGRCKGCASLAKKVASV